MIKQEFPILEYDGVSHPIVNAKKYLPDFIKESTERCVITYFSDVVERYERVFKVNQAFKIRTEGVRPRVFFMAADKGNGHQELIYVVPIPVGAPQAARVLETLAAIGVKKVMVCGGAGSLDDRITQDKTLIPISAVRDEGTSYHYLPPSREVELDPKVLAVIERTLRREGELYEKVKTWTTDGIFRETADKVELRKSEGCRVVEMECAAFYAVGKHKDISIGQILYAGDVIEAGQWSYRDWHHRMDMREKLFDLAVKCLLEM